MGRRKKYRVTVQRTEEFIIDLDAADEREARADAISHMSEAQVLGRVLAAPRASVPQKQGPYYGE